MQLDGMVPKKPHDSEEEVTGPWRQNFDVTLTFLNTSALKGFNVKF
jgi:hypothetical protein